MTEQICFGEHSGHTCVLASNKKFEEIKKLTQKPHFTCFNCGRVADSKEDRYNPIPLKYLAIDQEF